MSALFTVWAQCVAPRNVEAKSALAARGALAQSASVALSDVRAIPARYVLVRLEQRATRTVWFHIIDGARSSATRVAVVAEFRGRGAARRAGATLAGILRAVVAGAESQTATRARNQEWRIVSRPIRANTALMQGKSRRSSLATAISSGESSLATDSAQPDVRNERGSRIWLGARKAMGPTQRRRTPR